MIVFFFFQAEDGIRDVAVTGVQTCALPILILETLEERRDFSVHGDQGSNLYGREQTVASGAVVEKDDVAGLLAAEHTPAAQHLFENVAVADGRASQRDVFLGEDALEPKVGHGSSHDAMA